jgi:uncharacterized repeat protein (TIGR03806 family)
MYLAPRAFLLSVFLAILAPLTSFSGPLQRLPNTTLAMPASPLAFGYTSTNALGSLVFTNPVAIASPPGETNRLFIVEKKGLIVVVTNLAAPTRTIFMNLSASVISAADTTVGGEEGLLGMAFHPGYATNGYFYLFYTGNATTTASGRHDILSRFQVSAGNNNQGNAGSEVRYITQYDQADNHNAGDLHFGSDGYLYVSLGDEGGGDGQYGNCQRIDLKFFSAIMRLDVDKKPGSLAPHASSYLPSLTNYTIPADNPWVGVTTFNGQSVNANNVRTEFWAVGMRNPWRFSFDPPTGFLYLGHVGQNTREWIDIVTRGGNSGWNYWEGSLLRSNSTPAGFARTIPPLIDYGHTLGRVCVIGGIVYRGNRISQLTGSYLYGDYGSGEIWALRHSGTNVTQNTVILTDTGRMTAFGVDPSNGDALYASPRSGTDSVIKRIIYNATATGTPLPPTLADTGAFANLTSLAPNAGIVPYDLNVPFWSDNALKSRWFSVPNTNLTITFNSNANWTFPTGTVWIKHFDLITNTVPPASKRLETRLLVKTTNGVYGVTYRWTNSVNAILVPEEGLDEAIPINEGGIIRTQVWHYPSRNECLLCHTPAGGFGLGFRTEQLNHNFGYPGGTTNEIAAFSDAGYFSVPVTNLSSLLALAHATNSAASLEFRTRSFLAANCSPCHQPSGSAQQALWDARITTPTALAGLINGPLMNYLGNPSNHVITPFSASNSVLLTRISSRDPALQMPPLATTLVDTQAVALVTQWIAGLTNTFWLAAMPASQSVIISGASINYSVTNLATSDFTNSVTFSVSGLPAGVTSGFSPAALTGSGSLTLTLTAAANTPIGTYALTITGVGSGLTNTATTTLVVTSVAPPWATVWTATNTISANTNWSASLNWTNLTRGGYGPPGSSNDVIFDNSGATGTPGTTDNVVDATTTINSLWHRMNSAASHHTTLIAPNRALNITGTTNITGTGLITANYSLLVGTNNSAPNGASITTTLTGAGGTLNINNPTGIVAVAQFNTTSKHTGITIRSALNLAGLDTFTANVARFAIGSMNNGSAGTVYLAKTNLLTLSGTSPQMDIGDNNSNQGDPSFLYLGLTNAIFADTIATGRAKGTNGSIYFNPAFIGQNPAAYFRGHDGVSRVASWLISDLSSATGTSDVTAPRSTNDFTGGTVDILVDGLGLGKTTTGLSTAPPTGFTSNRVSIGTLTFNAGTINVNNLTNGWQVANSGTNSTDTGIGTINVNGTGTLAVNQSLILALGSAGFTVHGTNDAQTPPADSYAQGTLNINGGTVRANSILNGGGIAAVTVNNGTLAITNSAGTPAKPLSAISLTNTMLRLRVNGNSVLTNIVVTNLLVSGVNTIRIDALTNVTTTTIFPLFAYTTLNGSVSANFALVPLPGYTSSLIDNPGNQTIDLRLIPSASATPRFASILFSGTNLAVSGTNGAPNGSYYILTSTNLLLPLTNWTVLATNAFDGSGNFSSTNALPTNAHQQFYLLQLP